MLSILSRTKQIGMNTPRLPRVKQIASRKPRVAQGAQLSAVLTQRQDGVGWQADRRGRGCVCTMS